MTRSQDSTKPISFQEAFCRGLVNPTYRNKPSSDHVPPTGPFMDSKRTLRAKRQDRAMRAVPRRSELEVGP